MREALERSEVEAADANRRADAAERAAHSAAAAAVAASGLARKEAAAAVDHEKCEPAPSCGVPSRAPGPSPPQRHHLHLTQASAQ